MSSFYSTKNINIWSCCISGGGSLLHSPLPSRPGTILSSEAAAISWVGWKKQINANYDWTKKNAWRTILHVVRGSLNPPKANYGGDRRRWYTVQAFTKSRETREGRDENTSMFKRKEPYTTVVIFNADFPFHFLPKFCKVPTLLFSKSNTKFSFSYSTKVPIEQFSFEKLLIVRAEFWKKVDISVDGFGWNTEKYLNLDPNYRWWHFLALLHNIYYMA
jgi:hypothetical protein